MRAIATYIYIFYESYPNLIINIKYNLDIETTEQINKSIIKKSPICIGDKIFFK